MVGEHRAAAQGRHPRVHRRVRAQRAGAADDGARSSASSIPEIEARASRRSAAPSKSTSTTAGTLVEHADERYRGGPDRPFTREELHEKFTDCAALVLPPAGDRRDVRAWWSRSRRSPTSPTLVRSADRAGGEQLARRDEPRLDLGRARSSLAVTLSCTTTINVGVLSLALALLVGVFLGGMSPDAVLDGLSRRAVRHARRRDAALQHRRVQRHARAADRARRAPLPRPRGRAADHVLRARLRRRDDRRRRHAGERAARAAGDGRGRRAPAFRRS